MNDSVKAAFEACGEALARASDVIAAERALADAFAKAAEFLFDYGDETELSAVWERWREARQQ